jgi:hypothetical protein
LDGTEEKLLTSCYGDNTLAPALSRSQCCWEKADGTFDPAVEYTVNGNPHNVVIADFNGDRKVDIMAMSGLSSPDKRPAGRTYSFVLA